MRLTSTPSDAHTLAGAYAMDAITVADRERFEQHLAGCEECAQEIASLREATAVLGGAAAEPLPAGLKERVMAAAASTRQQPPAEEPAKRTRRSRVAIMAGDESWIRSLGWPGRLSLAVGAAAAAAVVALAAVFGVSNGGMQQQLDAAQSSSQQIAVVLTAHDAHMMTGAVAGGGTATIVMSGSRHALVFTAKGLHPLPSSLGYELWLMGPAGTRSVGMLPAGSDGMTGPVIALGLRAGDHLVLTAAPAGGSARPNAPMMLDVTL